MEPRDPYYHHHHHQPPQQPPRYPHHHQPLPPSPPPPTTANGILPNTNIDTLPLQMQYPHNSVPSAVSPPLTTGVRRKRGRPRKYSTPEQAAAAKRLSSLSPASKKDVSPAVGGSSTTTTSKKSSLGNAGQGFTPYIITVAAGEDINHKIMSFMQQSKQEICVVSASGVISNASLRQPATSGGNFIYEGRFDIISLCGSYVRSELESRTGGLSICMSSNDGQIIGGGVDGPLIAAGPVQVIVGTFVMGGKNPATVTKDDTSIGASIPNSIIGNNNNSSNNNKNQNSDGYPFMIPNGGLSGFNFSERVDHGSNHSPKNGHYGHFQD